MESNEAYKEVAIPYVIWTLIYVIIGNITSPANIPVSFLYNLITAEAAGVVYYVFVYCEFILLIPTMDKLARSKYKCLGFVISPLEIIIMRLFPLMTGYEVNKYIGLIMHVSCLGWFTYYYLGYMLGNGLLEIKLPTSRILILLVGAIGLQIAEGLWYFSMGEQNCGTQLKLSAILTGSKFVLLGYRYLETEKTPAPKILHLLGIIRLGYSSHTWLLCLF